MYQQSHPWTYIWTKLPLDTCTHMFIAALFTIAKTWNQHKCPLIDGLDQEDVVYIHNGILSHKKEQNNAICSNMDGTRDSHIEWSKSERERQIPYDITYLESNIGHKWTSPQKRKSGTWKIDLWLPDGRGKEWEGSGAWGYQIQLRIDLQGDPAE